MEKRRKIILTMAMMWFSSARTAFADLESAFFAGLVNGFSVSVQMLSKPMMDMPSWANMHELHNLWQQRETSILDLADSLDREAALLQDSARATQLEIAASTLRERVLEAPKSNNGPELMDAIKLQNMQIDAASEIFKTQKSRYSPTTTNGRFYALGMSRAFSAGARAATARRRSVEANYSILKPETAQQRLIQRLRSIEETYLLDLRSLAAELGQAIVEPRAKYFVDTLVTPKSDGSLSNDFFKVSSYVQAFMFRSASAERDCGTLELLERLKFGSS